MIDKLNESFDFDDIEQDESGIDNSIHGIRILGKIKDSIKNDSSYFVRYQVSDTFEEFVDLGNTFLTPIEDMDVRSNLLTAFTINFLEKVYDEI